jgi:hypothetical protein
MPVFFLRNFIIFQQPIFSGQGKLFGECFVLFCRKFRHLATVNMSTDGTKPDGEPKSLTFDGHTFC